MDNITAEEIRNFAVGNITADEAKGIVEKQHENQRRETPRRKAAWNTVVGKIRWAATLGDTSVTVSFKKKEYEMVRLYLAKRLDDAGFEHYTKFEPKGSSVRRLEISWR